MVQMLYQFVVIKRELSLRAKLLRYRSIYIPTLSYGHELWVASKTIRFRMPSGHLLGVSDKTYWDEALMHTKNTLERLHV